MEKYKFSQLKLVSAYITLSSILQNKTDEIFTSMFTAFRTASPQSVQNQGTSYNKHYCVCIKCHAVKTDSQKSLKTQ